MRLDRNELSKAVRMALSLGAVAAVGAVGTAQAQDQNASQTNQQPQTLQTIVVTGSHIRRVDLETANPVVTVDAAQIQRSGAVTVGDLVQQLPAITGSPQNTRVNNGGGTGGTFANLRGLGTGRTLVLVDGQRVLDNDLNKVPVQLIERVEVLTDGGAVTYGSDAIGGVINFILKKNYQGAEATMNYGISDRDDGERKGASFVFGQTSDKGSILAGVDYNKFAPVSSANRKFSKDAMYLSSGSVSISGSSRTPQAHVYGVGAQTGCANGQAIAFQGDGTALSDYRCYVSSRDAYNYQLLNYDLTPQERTNAFFRGDYQLTDNVQAYMDVFHNKTTSAFAIAPLPFDALSDGVVISKDSMFNPFGVDFGPTATSSNGFRTRFTGIGQRSGHFATTADQGIVGLKGNFGQSSGPLSTWQWDVNYDYGHESVLAETVGDLVYNTAFKNAVGPSMLVGGVPTCVSVAGNAATAIPGCTPLNIFDQTDPAVTAQLKPYQATFFSNNLTTFRTYSAGANGTVFTLPAGDVELAVGADYRKLYSHTVVSFLTQINTNPNDPAFGTCAAPQSACSSSLQGGYNVKEAYGELFVPILKDMPFAKALNVTLGDRYSKYSLAGSTNNWKVAVEYRPIDDLLLRGNVQKVFRAPTIGALFGAPTGNAPAFVDPCGSLSAAELALHPNACAFVAPNTPAKDLTGGTTQVTGVLSGSAFAGVNLTPEFGKSFDWGAVYSPHYLPGLTVSVDLWRIYLNNTITTLGAQTVGNICFGNDASPYCAYIHRFSAGTPPGQIHFINQPTVNLGRLDTKGVDASLTYKVPQFNWLPGQFTLTANGTYVAEYTNDTAPGTPGDVVQHVAGHYYNNYGSHPRVQGQVGLSWQLGSWDASWRTQYIGHETVGSANPAEGNSADGQIPNSTLRIPTVVYNYLQVGYTIQPINTHISVGVDNVFDKQPPLFYQNNVLNANTDVNTYDTIGRFYWVQASVKF